MFKTKSLALQLSALALMAFVLFGCATNPQSNTDAGKDLVTASDATEAQKLALIRLELASGYFQQGQSSDALDSLKQSIQLDPSNVEAYNLRGLIYMSLNENKLAEESFRRALGISTRNGSVMHNYGWLLCTQTRFKEAADLFSQALVANGYNGHAKTHMAAGLCHQRSGLMAEAEASFKQAYELDPGNPIVGYNLALLLYQRHDFSRAQFYVSRINRSELANAQTYWLGIKVERKLGDIQAMRQLGARLQNRFPASEEARKYERGHFED